MFTIVKIPADDNLALTQKEVQLMASGNVIPSIPSYLQSRIDDDTTVIDTTVLLRYATPMNHQSPPSTIHAYMPIRPATLLTRHQTTSQTSELRG